VKHKGKAKAAFQRMMLRALGIYWILGLLLVVVSHFLVPGMLKPGVIVLTGLLVGFALFAGYFFRDPDAAVPAGQGLIVAPGHGTVDVIDETEEPSVMGGRCRRVSIFLSVFNVHVQQAPVAGTVIRVGGVRVGVRLIAGLIARRIIPWLKPGESVAKGERIALIRFGSRANLYLPMNTDIVVKLGDKVVGGTTVMARIPA